MEIIERNTNLKTQGKQQTAPSKILWIRSMNVLGLELERLNALFIAASFTLVRQDFQDLIFLRQSHANLKDKMVRYFKDFRNTRIGIGRNLGKSQAQTSNNLELELQVLTSRLKKFTDNLLKVKRNTHGYL